MLKDGAAIYPYKIVDEGLANCTADKEMNLLAGKGLLVNPNECDPVDQDDPRNQNDGQTRQLWDAFQGKCVEVNLHFHRIIVALLMHICCIFVAC